MSDRISTPAPTLAPDADADADAGAGAGPAASGSTGAGPSDNIAGSSPQAARLVRSRRRARWRLWAVGAVLVGAFAFLLAEGLGGSLNYFETVDQAIAHKAMLGARTFRLEGVVVPGTVKRSAAGVRFVAAGTHHRVAVVNSGEPPQLFQPNIPVVVVGHFSGATFYLGPGDHRSQRAVHPGPSRSRAGAQRDRAVNAALGHSGVLLSLAAAGMGIVTIAYGLVRRRPEAMRAAWVYVVLALVGAVVATVAMERALVTHDFSFAFVAANNSRATPLLYTITGMWSALAGSILLWGLILAAYIAAMVWRFRRQRSDPLVAWATLVTLVVAAFFFGLMAGPADPFRTVAGAAPANGLGPNVLLQDNALVAFHPPILYLGFVGFTVPFAFAIASLVTGRDR